jgi:nicotinate-nucleotide adenylyltransferase
MATLALLGGTFDPVHHGHLHLAADVRTALALPEVRLVPAADPPHRAAPGASASHRLAMLHLGVAGFAGLAVDAREVERGGASYTVDTLADFRREAPARPLAWIVGADAFLGLPTWRRWTELFELAHIIVVARPGIALEGTLPAPLAAHWSRRIAGSDALDRAPAGAIVRIAIAPHAISASALRADLAAGRIRDVATRGLLPASVLAYIEQHRLYGTV